MQAIQFDDFGGPEVLILRESSTPELRPSDLLVHNAGVGVNRADISHRKGAYGRAYFGDSSVMGLEISGTVIALGSEVVGYSVGDRVMGIVGGGAYAEISRIDYRMAMLVPERIDLVEAAAIPEVFVTAHEALIHLGRLDASHAVLIHAAAGGVGSAAIQLAKATGARVFATCDASKSDRVRAMGADVVIDYKSQDFLQVIMSETAGKGVEVIVDFVGAPNLERNVRALTDGGRLVQVGLLGGSDGAVLPLDLVLFKHLQIMGTVMKSRPPQEKQAMVRRFADRWLNALAAGSIGPVIDQTFPLFQAAEAHRRMESNQSIGKILLSTKRGQISLN